MKNLLSTVITVMILASGLMAQQAETLFGESGLHLTGAWGGPVTGVSIFDGNTEGTQGGFFGFEFNQILLIGFGNEKTIGSVQLNNQSKKYNFKHKGFFVGYYPNQHKIIHPFFNFMLGGGEIKTSSTNKDNLFAVQPSGGLEVNIFQWWKLGLEGGYRFVSGTDMADLDNSDISSPFINLKFRFGWSW